jgi:hypothetical protein
MEHIITTTVRGAVAVDEDGLPEDYSLVVKDL